MWGADGVENLVVGGQGEGSVLVVAMFLSFVDT